MKIQFIRNATLRIAYAGRILLIDPYFARKGTLPAFADRAPNPTSELPVSPETICEGVELVVVSHLHTDHFDAAAQEILPKALPVLCQPGDEGHIADKGFSHVTPLMGTIHWKGIQITRTHGQHGEGETLKLMGNVMGFVLQAENEPTLYWAGDTIWIPEIPQILTQFSPDVIVTHSGGAVWKGSAPIIMEATQTLKMVYAAPNARVIAVHMEALDHCMTTRDALHQARIQAEISGFHLMIPEDGETMLFGETYDS